VTLTCGCQTFADGQIERCLAHGGCAPAAGAVIRHPVRVPAGCLGGHIAPGQLLEFVDGQPCGWCASERERIAAAVDAEREACAEIAHRTGFDPETICLDLGDEIARRIRARSERS